MNAQLEDMTGMKAKVWSPDSQPCDKTIKKWIDEGKIPGVRIGRHWFFYVDKVKQAIERNFSIGE